MEELIKKEQEKKPISITIYLSVLGIKIGRPNDKGQNNG